MNNQIKKYLGMEIQDKVTGFKGIVERYTETIQGNDRVSVRPKVLEGSENIYPSGVDLDVDQITIIGPGVSDIVKPVLGKHIDFGKYVRNTITGIEGTIVAKHTFLNGCLYYSYSPNLTDKQKNSLISAAKDVEHFFDPADRLFVLDIPEFESIEVIAQENKTGGPTTKTREIKC